MYAVVEVVASMKIIKELISQIHDEVKDANKYIECTLKYRDEDRGLADMYNNLSLQESNHMDMLHSAVVKIIENYRKEHGEPPEAMEAVYNWEHEKIIEEVKEIKILQSMYKS